jgi:hypothetical protein
LFFLVLFSRKLSFGLLVVMVSVAVVVFLAVTVVKSLP